LARGASWLALGQLLSQGYLSLVALVTAPALTPAAFGAVAIQLILVSASLLLADGGFAAAIIREPMAQRNALLRLAIASGAAQAVLGIVVVLVARPASDSVSVLLVIALAPATAMTLAVQSALAAELRFRDVGLAQAAAAVSALAVALLTTAGGQAIWAVPTSFAAYQAVQLLLHRRTYRSLYSLAAPSTRAARRFAAGAYGSNALNLLGGNVDYMLVGILLGSRALGIYALAYVLSTSLQSRVMSLINRTAYPVMANLDPQRRGDLYASLIITVAVVAAPVYTTLFVFAPDLVPLIFGTQWVPAVPIARPLILAGFALTVGSSIGPPLLAGGRSDILLGFGVIRIIGVGAAVAIGASQGLTGVIVGIIVYALVAVPVSIVAAVWKSGIDVGTFASGIAKSASMAVPVLLLSVAAIFTFADAGRWLAPLAVVAAAPMTWLLLRRESLVSVRPLT
jgi:O-antigen/teichoic acid export membrane protein